MIRTLWFVIVTAAFVVGAVWIAERPGEVMLAWGDWRIGMRMSVLVLAILVFAIAVALAYRLWVALRRAPATLRHGWRQSRRERGYKALTQGMVAVSAGDGAEARRQATKADALLNEPPLTMLLSAQAAQLNGDEAAARRYFTAMLERPETAFLGIRGLLMQARRDDNDTEALALADRAYALKPKTPWVLSTKYELEARAGQWRTAIGTLEEAVKRGAYPPAEARNFRVATLLGASLDAERDGRDDEALSFARRACDTDETALAATLRHAALLAKAGRRRRAARVIEQGWARRPHPELARLYGTLIDDDNALQRVKQTEKLIAANPEHPESHFALAIAQLEAQLWGAARTHLDAAGGEAPPSRVCQAMARLEEQDGGDMAAVRAWLLRAGAAEPDPAWVCSGCGAASPDWAPLCGRCQAIGSFDWRPPDRAAALPTHAAPPAPPVPAFLVPPAPDDGEAATDADAAGTPQPEGSAR